MQKPVIIITLAYTVGLLLGNAFLYFPYSIGAFLAAGLIVYGFVAWFRRAANQWISPANFFLAVLPCLAGMIFYLYSAAWLPRDHYTRSYQDGRVTDLVGRISSVLDRDLDRTSFSLGVHEMDGAAATGTVRVIVREAATGIGYGDVVRISGKLFSPRGLQNPGGFDYPAYLARSGISHAISLKKCGQIEVVSSGSGPVRTIQDWRERIRQAFLSSTSGPGSAILQAMVLGEEGGITDEMRDRFLAAGVTHIISISGSHLGMVAFLCFALVSTLMRLLPEKRYHWLTIHADPKKIAAVMTLPLVIFYTLLAGGQTATVRALVMILAALAAVVLDRESRLLHALAIAAFAILIADPQALFDISFQLSFLSVFSIGSVALLWKDLRIEPKGRVKSFVKNIVLLGILSLAASLSTGPLVARYFNQFSLAGLFSNIVIVPFAGIIVVPLGLLSGILSLFMHGLPFAGLNQFAADLFIRLVGSFSLLPFAEFHPRSPGVVSLLLYAVLITSVFMVLRARLLAKFRPFEYSSRFPRGPAVVAVASFFVLAAASGLSFLPRSSAEVWAPDVGQGDACLVRLPGNTNILIDGGGSYDDRFDVGRSVLAPFLWKQGVGRLDLVILSHPHPDHMNGLKFILKKFNVGELWSHGLDTHLPGYDDLFQIVRERNIPHKTVSAGSPAVKAGEAELSVLHPGRGFRSRERKEYAAENDRSLVLRIAFRGRVLLLTGDIGAGAEKFLVRAGNDLKCDLLKAPHHGSKSSSSEEFVDATRPSFVVIPVGKGNRYRHPFPAVVDRYERTGTTVLRTDRDGAVAVRFEDNGAHAVQWNERELARFKDIRDLTSHNEGENWKRLWFRKWEL